ncbi:hypothetical protein LTR10_017504 [Elasticomyces elasticus]|uniref:CoA carboxyltransferase C-terminal domain-containing protein n=1 Tax=Exophiala sideris TaxID=1016849 RepID=A0ABR0IZE5_9EURO|nr:hypothetical protein LTR10_017504 [Elasticomyces elasticus]KAK5023491.1 hypothetical protein LTS07_009366 [Exophiala sideris]KAK5028134.1 hypothetical protein LTR13_009122 [Exophiala sideris]KAK5052792.1 hypothetical protein LTR69_009618 [Exophiala sideris]KAK5178403.1 hypothetical protein LTR44_009028 [Eurotiomycetes sp. CCFEE 6388]
MGSKKSTSSRYAGGDDCEGQSSSAINDPVYSQRTIPDQPSNTQWTRPKSSEQIRGKDDPVYSQSVAVGDDHEGQPQTQINDPVYAQPTTAQTQPRQNVSGTEGRGSIDAAADPVYSQSSTQRSTNTQLSDPVYAQPPQTSPSTPANKASSSPGQGSISPADDPVYSQSRTAANRLDQLKLHVSSDQPDPASATANTSRSRRSKRPKSKSSDPSADLPADYSDILDNISRLQSIAQTPDANNRGYIRQKTSGKLWARERISALLDADTWREIGSVTGTVEWVKDAANPQREHVKSFTPSNNPQGFGRITCPRTGQQRQIYLTADDFSIRSGHADGSVALKTVHGEKLALKLKVPVVKLVDGSSGGGSVSTILTNGFSYVPHVTVLKTVVQQLNMGIPNLGAVVGPAIGLGAARVVSTHFSVMAGDIGSMFNAGPKVVEGATFEEGLSFADLGGPNVHCTNGTIDNMASNEQDCFDQIRTVLGYLPDCGMYQAPPVVECKDDVHREDVALRSIIPRRKNRMYNPSTIIDSVVDQGSWFEIGRLWGRTGITGLARMGGRPVGILSNNCEVNSGALDALGSQKLLKMIKFCDVFNLPIVQFVDVPGYAIGTVAERSATMKWGVELGKAYYSTTTPIFSVITRRVYGVAGGIMLDSREPWMRIAWPSGNWGSLPLDGGIEVGHRHELKQIGEKQGPEAVKQRYKELEDEYLRLMNPIRTAQHFNVEEIVDPKDTRRIVCRWAKEMYGVLMQERLADRAAGRVHAVFT